MHKLVFRLFSAILLFALAGSAAAEDAPKMKKFLTKPLVIEDQGSFFIGGVPKVTNYATVPRPANQQPAPNQITIGQMYVQFEIPADQEAQRAPGHHGAWVHAYGGLSGIDAGRPGRLVSLFRPQGHLDLPGGSGRTRTLRVRRVGTA